MKGTVSPNQSEGAGCGLGGGRGRAGGTAYVSAPQASPSIGPSINVFYPHPVRWVCWASFYRQENSPERVRNLL